MRCIANDPDEVCCLLCVPPSMLLSDWLLCCLLRFLILDANILRTGLEPRCRPAAANRTQMNYHDAPCVL